ncbi:DUF805 domain-containing protein [Deinococcus multiflagellatus]|uniref:DUF805 domain-containing protein n=1 Tax=Deinococcus multiflagellatus TaxID=1656887 RepID=A0ABW1ZJE8_9DEIO|nr:DUF805 domain-containing protein [Deinococcus multiflagellatus]MBZ9713213.1 DUF805 domain-containing protein [Deinococcus multiflagellatus]
MNEYLKVIKNNYANFRGRARRREFWMFTLINTIILVLLMLPWYPAYISSMSQGETGLPFGAGGLAGIFSILYAVYTLAMILPTLAVTVRRLHDTGKSGWWYLLNLIPFGSIVILVFTVLDSEPGANKWGPNPKGLNTGAAAPASNW